MKTILISTVASIAALPALAQSLPAKCAILVNPGADPDCSTAVPEISALEGTAALAALAAIVLIAWERRRRAV